MDGLHPLTAEALAATSRADYVPQKHPSQLAAEHDAAAEAHERASKELTVHQKMHEDHARIHRETAETMRRLSRGETA